MTDSLQRIHQQIATTANYFRMGMEAMASDSFVKLVESLLTSSNTQNTETAAQLNFILSEIIAAQQRCDYLYIADLLQYELQPLLE
ncbi:MAG: hypothetical protein OEZ58_23900 [Gammaproteobacteria bacterium]|nr:hypothetical protein [Gammaproteobacteria bacterium]MDH5732039.1 hypothetical protein [Gammaproteobacteria bacterium]